MIQSITRKNTLYYQASLVVIMLALISVIFYFWRLGFLDGSKSKDLHRANFLLESIEQKNPIKEIKKLVLDENNKLALSSLDSLEKELTEIDKLLSEDGFDQVRDEHQQIKSNVASLVSFTKSDKVVEIFHDKVQKFYDYVKLNNWRTLTRSSNRILTMTGGYINKSRFDSFIKKIENEVALMQKVTKDSILTRAEKSEILSRLDQFDIELKMLKRYSKQKDEFLGMIKGYSQTLNAWIVKVSPEISVQKLKLEHMGKYFIMNLFGVLGLSILLFAGGFYYNRKQAAINRLSFEKFIKDYVSENLIKGKMLSLSNFSESFKDYSVDTQNYIEKRMNFGAIFGQALPFASMLLDNNLRLIWANSQFCEDWEVSSDNLKKSNITWDYLIKFTNLKDNDPIIEAVRNNVAGIYQIKLQLKESANPIPFEMYVSPVKQDNETKVMAFFYPLDSLEETINDQAKSIINPVNRLLTSMTTKSLSFEEFEKLEADFKQAQIPSVYNSFKTYLNENENQKERLFDEIEVLNSRMNEYEELIETIESKNGLNLEILSDFNKGLKTFKTNIIDVIEKSNELNSSNSSQAKILLNAVHKLEELYDKYQSIRNLSEMSLTSITKMNHFKDELKMLRSYIDESKARLSHSIGQMVHVKNKIENHEVKLKFSQGFSKLNEDFLKFNSDLKNLEKEIISIEVLMSKNEMLINSFNQELQSLDIDSKNFEIADIKNQTKSAHLEFNFEQNQEEIIESMHIMFTRLKESKAHYNSLESHIHTRSGYQGFLSKSDPGQIQQ